MKLKSVKVKNFRGYKNECIVHIDDSLTAIIGKNDVGKSTILEAIDIFLNNNESTKAEKADLNINSDVNEFEITCIFDDLPNEIILDASAKTTFKDEYLLNKNADLEIVKNFKNGAKVVTTFIRANQPIVAEVENSLHMHKIADLKKLAAKLKIDSSSIDERKSSDWRQLIFSNFLNSFEEKLIDISKAEDTAKPIFDKIQSSLPVFALFKSDRSSSDVDPEAKDPLQVAVKNALKEHEVEITKIEQAVQAQVLDVANRTLEKLKEMDPLLSKELKPRFKEKPKWTFNFTIDSDEGVPLNKRGSGVRRLVLLNFFRAEAEKNRSKSQTGSVIYAIEEPETSQHPNYQRMLIESLLRLSEFENTQVILTTHVPALAEMLPIKGLRYVTKEHEAVINEPTEETLLQISKSLGVLPEREVAGARAIILVEGPSDVFFLNHISDCYVEKGYFTESFISKKIVPVPTGGCGNLKNWVTLNVVTNLGLKWGVFMDSDKGTENEKVNLKHKNEIELLHPSAPIYLTKKREIENYICPTVILSLKNKTVTFTELCDAKKIIGDATSVKKAEVLETFWQHMSADKVLAAGKYIDGHEKDEFHEMLTSFISLV